MTSIIVALIALLGTLTVALIGFFQWSKSRKSERSKDYRAQRVSAITAVWEALSEIEERQRQALVPRDYSDEQYDLRRADTARVNNIATLRSSVPKSAPSR
jgi:hypothetical protein